MKRCKMLQGLVAVYDGFVSAFGRRDFLELSEVFRVKHLVRRDNP